MRFTQLRKEFNYKGIVLVNKDRSDLIIGDAFVKHEIGHILHYRKVGRIRFFWMAMTSLQEKKRALNQGNLKRYYSTKIEEEANKFFGLSWTDFVVTPSEMTKKEEELGHLLSYESQMERRGF